MSNTILEFNVSNQISTPDISQEIPQNNKIVEVDPNDYSLVIDNNEKIPFSFYRYSIKNSYLKVLPPKGAPDIFGYNYYKENIREGYLYISYESKDGIAGNNDNWEEYEISKYGSFYKIINNDDNNKYDKDFRHKSNDALNQGVLFFDSTDIMWIAYAEQQLTADYLKKIMSDSTLKEKRFQKLDVSQWLIFLEQRDKDFDLLGHYKRYRLPKSAYNKSSTDWIETEYIDDKKSYADYYYKNTNASTKKFYHSFCLHDPIGIADDLRVEQLKSLTQLDSMLGKMPIGNPNDYKETSQEEFSYMYLHALTFYAMFYGDTYNKGTKEVKESIEGLRDHIVKKEFLEKILMVKERKTARDSANFIRTKIFDFVKTDYYLNMIDDMIENHPIRMEKGIGKIVDHHMGLAWDANSKDKHINVDNSAKSQNEKVKEYLNSVTDTNHRIYQLLAKGYYLEDFVFLEEKEQISIGNTIGNTDVIWSNMTNILLVWHEQLIESISDYTKSNPSTEIGVEVDATQGKITGPVRKTNIEGAIVVETKNRGTKLVVTKELMEKWCGKVEVRDWLYKSKKGKGVRKNTHVFDQMRFYENIKDIRIIGDESTTIEVVEKFMKKGGTGNKGKVGVPTQTIAEAKDFNMSGYKKNIAIDILIHEVEAAETPLPHLDEFATINAAKLTRVQKIASYLKIFDSKIFIGLTGTLSVLNLLVVTKTDFSNRRAFSAATYTAAITEVTQFGLQFLSFYIKNLTAIAQIRSITAFAGGISSIAMGVVSLIESIDAFTDNNMTSGLLYAGAAAAFFTAGFLTLASFVYKPKVGNLYIAIAAAIGAVLFFVGSMFKYTPMEKYLANCILQKSAIKKIKNWENLDGNTIIEKLCLLKNDIVSEDHSQWQDLQKSIEYLTSLLINMDIKLSTKTIKTNDSLLLKVLNHKVKKAVVSCYYKNLTFGSKVRYGLRVFYTKPYLDTRETLYYKDFDGIFEETTYGCKVVYETVLLEQDLPSGCEIVDSYFFQHIKDGNDVYYPPKIGENDVFFAQRIMINEIQTIATISPASSYKRTVIEDFIDYCMEKDKIALDLDRLHEIVLSLNMIYKKIEKG